MLAEPAFSHGASWPPAGLGGLPPEPDDPRPAFARDTLLVEPALPSAEWRAGSASLDRPADEPLQAARAAAPARRTAWKGAVLASCLLHAAVALAFLTGMIETVEIAGSDQAGVMLLGNAPDDQSSAGDGMEATNVTLVTMLDPKPVATVSAEAVGETDRVEAVEDAAPPVEETAEPAPQPSVNEAVESETGVAAPMAADPTPEVLTARAAEPADVVPRHVESIADATNALPTQAAEPPDPVAAEEVAFAEPKVVEDVPPPQPGPVAETRPVERIEATRPPEEKPVKKPIREKPGKKTAAKERPTDKAERADKARKKSGSGGRNEADSRRGALDGQAAGRKDVAGKGGAASSAGNAAASNYPGKVAAKLRRAVRGVSRSARARASNDVLVSFTVNAGGGLDGVRIARSSGSTELDQTALAVVRRAAPFPPIPAETGRMNWAFTLPLGMR